jgi:hypothetical protein
MVRLLESRQNVIKVENAIEGQRWNGVGQWGVATRR